VGAENIDKVIRIDQSPIGRTPRSNPATYTGVFTAIRDIYGHAAGGARARFTSRDDFPSTSPAPAARPARAKASAHRDETFCPDVYVLCEVCGGRVYNHETLAVKYNGDISLSPICWRCRSPTRCHSRKHSADKTKAANSGRRRPRLHSSRSICVTTLPGGEAQRIKLPAN